MIISKNIVYSYIILEQIISPWDYSTVLVHLENGRFCEKVTVTEPGDKNQIYLKVKSVSLSTENCKVRDLIFKENI